MLNKTYKALPHSQLNSYTTIRQPRHQIANSLTPDSPALSAMTDLQKVPAYTIHALANIDDANDKMIICGVRSLFVTDAHGQLNGLITATDILGEKPMKFLSKNGGYHSSILVQDIMTERNELEAVSITSVEQASVGDIVESLLECRRQHMLVVEPYSDNDQQIIRGIFSSTQIEKQLGIKMTQSGQARTFAELERALVADI